MNEERTEGGDRIYRYSDQPERELTLPEPDDEAIAAIEKHYTAFFGEADGVYHEILSDIVHLDVHIFPPCPGRSYYVLATTGMSDRPMAQTPSEHPELAHAELLIYLPADWPLFKNGWQFNGDDAAYWPVGALKFLARMPHEYRSWLSWGHTIPNGPKATPIGPNTQLGCWCLVSPGFVAEAFQTLEIRPGKTVNFFQVVPIYKSEMELKMRRGMEGLLDVLDHSNVTREEFLVLSPNRPNAVPPRGLFGWLKRG